MLDIAIVDDRQRLTIFRTQQKDQAAIGPRLNAVFVLDHPVRLIPRPGDDVGLHANREHPMAAAFHGPPAVIAVFAIAGRIKNTVARAAWPYPTEIVGRPVPERRYGPPS